MLISKISGHHFFLSLAGSSDESLKITLKLTVFSFLKNAKSKLPYRTRNDVLPFLKLVLQGFEGKKWHVARRVVRGYPSLLCVCRKVFQLGAVNNLY